METIYLVHHGEALDDVEDRYGGWSDDPLTEKGKQTARELAQRLNTLSPKPKKIYSSPFKRAHETAKIISSVLEIPGKKVDELKERNRYGVLTSLTKTEAIKKYPKLVEKVKDYMQTIDEAETYKHYKDRVLKGLNKILNKLDEDILIVCHGGTFRIVMWELLGRKDYEKANLHAILKIEKEGNKLELKTFEGLKLKS